MNKKFSWEKEYRRTWEDTLETREAEHTQPYRTEYNPYVKGVIRHLHVVIDTSSSIDKADFLPTFRSNITKVLKLFIPLFYRENPLSILTFLSVRDISDMYCNNPNVNISMFLNKTGSGTFSLLNALKSSIEILKEDKYVKEILLITGSLSTKDHSNFDDVVLDLKRLNIKVHIVSLCGEITIYKKLCKITKGKFSVPVDVDHLSFILNGFCTPSESKSSTLNLVQLGFPTVVYEPLVCACHLKVYKSVYECPVCKASVCSLPIKCPICETQLVSTIHLTRTYHHMYPLKPFNDAPAGACVICSKDASVSCGECNTLYCSECDTYLHNYINFCPFCK